MKRTRIAIVGFGWRGQQYLKVCKELEQFFDVVLIVVRSLKKINNIRKIYDGVVTDRLNDISKYNVDFVVSCVPPNQNFGVLNQIICYGIPVLCETPICEDIQDMVQIRDCVIKRGAKLQIAEQYIFSPYYQACKTIVSNGLLGEINVLEIYGLHDYHAIAMIRFLLGTCIQKLEIWGHRGKHKLVVTDSKSGIVESGKKISTFEDIAVITVNDNVNVIYNYTRGQYFSRIRNKRLLIRGSSGELDNNYISYVNKKHEVIQTNIVRHDYGIYSNHGWGHYGFSCGNEYIYKNPRYELRLNDDEIAITHVLLNMCKYIEDRFDFYTLETAIEDAYLGYQLRKVIQENSNKILKVER